MGVVDEGVVEGDDDVVDWAAVRKGWVTRRRDRERRRVRRWGSVLVDGDDMAVMCVWYVSRHTWWWEKQICLRSAARDGIARAFAEVVESGTGEDPIRYQWYPKQVFRRIERLGSLSLGSCLVKAEAQRESVFGVSAISVLTSRATMEPFNELAQFS